MTMIDSRTTRATRRQMLRGGLRIAAGASLAMLGVARAGAQASGAAVPVTFLSRADGAAALTRTPGDNYYANMRLLESRSRTNSPMKGMSLAEARVAVRDYEAAAVRSFTAAEAAAIRGLIEHLQPLLAARAPLYARTPWSFIKLADDAEGGMPHTRGPHIVMPESALEGYVQQARDLVGANPSPASRFLTNVLVHEQTHVLERAHPALFEPLITDVFGFTRMAPAPTTPWLETHEFANPDGPDVVWAFPLDKIGGSGWVMPHLTVPDLELPRMPQDFQAVGVEVVRTGAGWQVVEQDGLPKRRDLDKIPGYDTHFPFPDEDFHPNEIAAVALSHWILQDVPGVNQRPLMPAVAGWARKALA